MTDAEVLEKIVAAWWAETTWEQFGHQVGDILITSGVVTTRPSGDPPLR